MLTSPIKMLYEEPITNMHREVLVYDFIHEYDETFETLALCWDEQSSMWLTVSIAFLSPIINNNKKLNEDIKHGN